MVSADADLEEVMLGDGGLSGRRTARVLVDSQHGVGGDIRAEVRAEAAERGVGFLAAPVSGNAKVVTAGRLSMAVSGPRGRVRSRSSRCWPRFGQSVTYVGEGDLARLVKLAHNVFLGVVDAVAGRDHGARRARGCPAQAFLEFMNGSVLGSVFTGYKTPAFVNLDLTPTFTTELLRKDFDLGLAAARDLDVPMPVAAMAHQLVQDVVGRGHGDEDFVALLVEQAKSAGLSSSRRTSLSPTGSRLRSSGARRRHGRELAGSVSGGSLR